MEGLSYVQIVALIMSLLLGWAAAWPFILGIKAGGFVPSYGMFGGLTVISIAEMVLQYKSTSEGDYGSLLFIVGFGAIPCAALVVMVIYNVPRVFVTRDYVSIIGFFVFGLAWLLTNGSQGLKQELTPLLLLALTDLFINWPILHGGWKGDYSDRDAKLSWSITALSCIFGLFTVANPWSLEVFIPGYICLLQCVIALVVLVRPPAQQQSV